LCVGRRVGRSQKLFYLWQRKGQQRRDGWQRKAVGDHRLGNLAVTLRDAFLLADVDAFLLAAIKNYFALAFDCFD